MKKVLLAAAILMGAASALPTMSVTATAQTCDPNSPCLYTGTARASNLAEKQIIVKYDKNGNLVAEVKGEGTYYVFASESEADKSHGTHYVNVNSIKYYFNM